MIEGWLLGYLDGKSVPFCLIGASALAARGFARFTADVDLLTLSADVLRPEFWAGFEHGSVEIRQGEPGDPLRGVVRLGLEPVHDLVVGLGYAAKVATDTAETVPTVPCKVATPLGLVLLKLEAGSPRDRLDILGLVSAQRELTGAPWLPDLPGHIPRLSREAQAVWEKVKADLPG